MVYAKAVSPAFDYNITRVGGALANSVEFVDSGVVKIVQTQCRARMQQFRELGVLEKR